MLRGIITGMVCGLVTVLVGLLLFLLIISPATQQAESLNPVLKSPTEVPVGMGTPQQDLILVSPLAPLKDRSKPAGPELLRRAPTNPQLWNGGPTVLQIKIPKSRDAPIQTTVPVIMPVASYQSLVVANDVPPPRIKPSQAPVIPALVKFAERNDRTADQAQMSIILLHDESSIVDLDILAAFPHPISFAIDPKESNSVSAMQTYRARGFEVIMLASFDNRASSEHIRSTLRTGLQALPQTVAVMESQAGSMQINPAIAAGVSEILQNTGHGLILLPSEAHSVRALAQRIGVPTATVFRDVDGKNQDSLIIQRLLDQASLIARNEGPTIIVGRLRPETIKALVLWGLQERSSRVALTPISSILLAQMED